jgi:DNA repair and recombination protein RAD52
MTFKPTQIDALKAPLHTAHVKQREQGGKTLSYVEAWWAIAEANRIFGFDAWTRETVLLQETNRDIVELQGKSGPYKQWRVGYLAKVRITVDGIVREGTGFGSGMSKPEALGEAIESAAKEAESDAMKRALMTFGNPFGLALYDKTQANVTTARPEVSEPSSGRKSSAQAKRDGDDAKIKADIAKADHAGLKDWAENFDSYTAHLPASWLDSIRDMMEHRLEELAGEDRVAPEAAELDDAFRGTVHRGSAAGVAGNGRDVAHAG